MKRHFGILVFLLVLLLGSEIGLRLAALIPTESATAINDPNIGFRLRPDIPVAGGVTNRGGFNDREHDPIKPQGTYRVAVIGDSFVFGRVPRQQNFVQRLEKSLTGIRSNVEVINLGIPAAGPHNYRALLEHDATNLQADLAVVMVFLGNDIIQAHPDFRTRVRFGRTVEVLRRPWLLGPSLEYAYLYRLSRAAYTLLLNRFEPHSATHFSRSAYLAVEQRRAQAFRAPPDRFLQEAIQGLLTDLSAMSRHASEQGMGLVVVLAPDEQQTDDRLWNELQMKTSLDPNQYQRTDINQRLGVELAARHIPSLDLLAAFTGTASNEDLYLPSDSHWSVKGNEIAAREILPLVLRAREPNQVR